ncbi:LysR family transcriptional regulator [Propionivibrio limicola]|uniref:LysR family transcriptional regulator n=1 Tax=Propionivibrio limicola TaxID=167645 RepID=UPI001290E43E|nr:LysR family transcriptional regulator [Propionivibrio limicola]
MNEGFENEQYLDPKDLRLLDVLYTTRSVTRTAELMGQTQPRISIWLKRIRDQLQDPLFVRTSQGMAPTARAEVVVGKAREILDAMHQITDTPVFDPLTSSRIFRMCIPDGAQTTLLPSMLHHIYSVAPNVRFEALPLDKNTPRLLETGEADLAFGGFVPEMVAGFYEQTLFDQAYICLVNVNHPRIKTELTIDDFQREAHVAFGYGRSYEIIESEMKQRNITRRVLVYLPGVLGVAKIIASTEMITTLPGQIGTILGNSSDAVRVFPCPVPLPNIVVKQFWHARVHRDPAHQWLRGICADEARAGMAQLLEHDIAEHMAVAIE